jgi:hypothetical protein
MSATITTPLRPIPRIVGVPLAVALVVGSAAEAHAIYDLRQKAIDEGEIDDDWKNAQSVAVVAAAVRTVLLVVNVGVVLFRRRG